MDIGLLLLRGVIGLTLTAHGARKLFGWFGGPGLDALATGMESLGFHPGRRHARMAGFVELFGGLLLFLGLATPAGAALVSSVMLVAAITAHLKKGFFITGGGFEYNLVLGATALSLAFTGPGGVSLDALLGYSRGGLYSGIGALALGSLGAGIMLAQRRRPGAEKTASAA
jgi:putative oxidoreductase